MTWLIIGCSGWNYGEPAEKGGWVGSFYPNSKAKRLAYYSEIFPTAELDATFYERLYSKMSKNTFRGMAKATPNDFQFSVKVPETITHARRLDVNKGAMAAFEDFLDKISPLKEENKLGAILIQLAPSFSVNQFRQVEGFLDKLPSGYDYALEFRHPSWQTEGPWEMLKHYDVAAVMTDSPDPSLQYLSEIALTSDHVFVRLHGRNKGFWYNYLYSKEELKPWVGKVRKIVKAAQARCLRVYFNNHYAGKAVFNALQFKEMIGELSYSERKALEHAEQYLQGKANLDQWTK